MTARLLLSIASVFLTLFGPHIKAQLSLSTTSSTSLLCSTLDCSKLSTDLLGLLENQPDDTIEVIARLKQNVSSTCSEIASAYGVQCTWTFKHFPLIVLKGKAKLFIPLAQSGLVEYLTPNRSINSFTNYSPDYAAATVGAILAQDYGFSGKGIGVAILDSSIYEHGDLKSSDVNGTYRIVYRESFIEDKETKDKYGHGTHVAGLVGGSGLLSGRLFPGVAPGVHLLDMRVLDETGSGTDAAVIAAIDRVIDLKPLYNIRVLNLSLGRPIFETYLLDPLCLAVERVWERGIVVVVAAGNFGWLNELGNEGYGTITSPGNHPAVITVGATRTMRTMSRGDDQIASYSSKGPTVIDHIVKPDIVAPGNLIASLLSPQATLPSRFPENVVMPQVYSSTASDPQYFVLSGTSMATPIVSGAAALLLERYPDLTPDQVKELLMKTAWKTFPPYAINHDPQTGESFTAQHDVFTIGAGALDVVAALTNPELPPALKATSPKALVNPIDGKVYFIHDHSVIWDSTPSWATEVVWGQQVFESGNRYPGGSPPLWGGTAAWGRPGTQGFSAVWGTGAVWGTQAVWGTSAVWGCSVDGQSSSTLLAGDQ